MYCLCVQLSLIGLKTSHCIKHTESTREHFNCLISLAEHSGLCYNKRILQRTFFINKIRMLQWTRRNTIGRRSTRVRMTCRAFPHWLESQSSSLLSFVRFSFQFRSVDYSSPPISIWFFMIFIRDSLFTVFIKERLFILFQFTCTVCKSSIDFVLFLYPCLLFCTIFFLFNP